MKRLCVIIILLFPCLAVAIKHTPWKLEGAQQRIEQYRKGDCELQLVLPDGSEVPAGTMVDVNQTRHAFQFGGSFCQGSRLFNHASFPSYTEHFADLFNYATVGFYWVFHERMPGTWSLNKNTHKVLKFALDEGMRVRGHPLMWHNTLPDFIENSKLPAEQLDFIINEHVRMLVREYPQIDEWDLYNEPPGIRIKEKSNGARRWVDWQGGPGPMIERMMDTVREVRPDGRYIINHFKHDDPEYHEMIEYLLDKEVSFDAIGIQAHMHTPHEIWSEKEMWKSFEKYSRYGKPLQITELSIVSCEPLANWEEVQAWERKREKIGMDGGVRPSKLSTPEGEAYQAAYARDFYTLAFSHPDVETIVWWSVSDVAIWRGIPSGLVDKMGNPKPAYKVLNKLINEDWRTHEQLSVTSGNRVSLRGFYGSYEVRMEHQGKTLLGTFELQPDKASVEKVVLMESR